MEYPRLQKWENIKIIKRISDNWADRANIQIEQNKKIMEYTKATDLKERESENQGNDIKIDDRDINNDILIHIQSELLVKRGKYKILRDTNKVLEFTV